MSSVRKYGWLPDVPDQRDFQRKVVSPRKVSALPAVFDPRAKWPMPYDQKDLGSCVGNGCAGAFQAERRAQALTPDFIPDRLAIYYNARTDKKHDTGAFIRDGIKALATFGAASEDLWPYDVTKLAIAPPAKYNIEAKRHLALKYERVARDVDQMRAVLASGKSIVFGFSVYDSFESKQVAGAGIVPMPKPSESLLGGHCVVAIGYNHAKKRFICRNSWGPFWGQNGYFTMDYRYLMDPNLSDDFWCVTVAG